MTCISYSLLQLNMLPSILLNIKKNLALCFNNNLCQTDIV